MSQFHVFRLAPRASFLSQAGNSLTDADTRNVQGGPERSQGLSPGICIGTLLDQIQNQLHMPLPNSRRC